MGVSLQKRRINMLDLILGVIFIFVYTSVIVIGVLGIVCIFLLFVYMITAILNWFFYS